MYICIYLVVYRYLYVSIYFDIGTCIYLHLFPEMIQNVGQVHCTRNDMSWTDDNNIWVRRRCVKVVGELSKLVVSSGALTQDDGSGKALKFEVFWGFGAGTLASHDCVPNRILNKRSKRKRFFEYKFCIQLYTQELPNCMVMYLDTGTSLPVWSSLRFNGRWQVGSRLVPILKIFNHLQGWSRLMKL